MMSIGEIIKKMFPTKDYSFIRHAFNERVLNDSRLDTSSCNRSSKSDLAGSNGRSPGDIRVTNLSDFSAEAVITLNQLREAFKLSTTEN